MARGSRKGASLEADIAKAKMATARMKRLDFNPTFTAEEARKAMLLAARAIYLHGGVLERMLNVDHSELLETLEGAYLAAVGREGQTDPAQVLKAIAIMKKYDPEDRGV